MHSTVVHQLFDPLHFRVALSGDVSWPESQFKGSAKDMITGLCEHFATNGVKSEESLIAKQLYARIMMTLDWCK